MRPSSPIRNNRRLAALDGLRGYAAMVVVFYHALLTARPDATNAIVRHGVLGQASPDYVPEKIAIALLSGEMAVAAFFLISGIVLFRALVGLHRGHGAGAAQETAWRFLLRRLLRIWPVMAICVVAMTAVFRLLGPVWAGDLPSHGPAEVLLNLSLLGFPVNGVTWTLAVELAGAPMLLLAFFAVRRWGLVGLLPFGLYAAVALKKTQLLFASPGLVLGVPFLLAGAAVESGLLAGLERRRWLRFLVLPGLLLALADELFLPVLYFKTHVVGLLVGLTPLVAWLRSLEGGMARRVLEARVSQFLGRVSFSLYLWNVPVLMLLENPIERVFGHPAPVWAGLLYGTCTVALTLPIAVLSERWLERPFNQLGHALTRRGMAPPMLATASGRMGSG